MSWLFSYLLPNRVAKESHAGTSSSRIFSVKDTIEEAIKQYDVVMFSKSFCPYCVQAKEAIQKYGFPAVKFGVFELDVSISVE
jgi:thioredoxin-related protein